MEPSTGHPFRLRLQWPAITRRSPDRSLVCETNVGSLESHASRCPVLQGMRLVASGHQIAGHRLHLAVRTSERTVGYPDPCPRSKVVSDLRSIALEHRRNSLDHSPLSILECRQSR